ncbi:nucleotide-diphospho-sugar transferase [Tanacetum coccineum]|uniref:Nucleotide-diphospho-sugar transferase n=1 Tax=Tanacetum coccineum TaxID=301880 RepID=A0ABQ4XFM2_9ASTR
MSIDTGTSSMLESDGTLNDATPRSKVVVSPYVVDDTMEKEKLSHVVTTTKLYPPLPMQVASLAGNALGKSLYVNVTGKPSGKKLNFHTLFTPGESGWHTLFPMDGLDAMLENGPWFICNNSLILRKWHPNENLLKEDVSTILVWVKLYSVHVTAFSEDGLSAIATKLGQAMIELKADVELKDNIVAAMPNINKECPKNIGDGSTKNLNKTSQTPKGILVGRKLGVKPKQVYQPVLKKSTANTCGKKMNNSKSTKEVSKSNPLEVLTLIDNIVDLGTNEGISNLADKGTINVSSGNTPIGEKIDKIERQICEGKLRFVDDNGNPLVPMGIVDSDSEVEVVFDETANLRISTSDNDDYDPYDDDMYENHDMSMHLQSICDDLDITVHGKKKK